MRVAPSAKEQGNSINRTTIANAVAVATIVLVHFVSPAKASDMHAVEDQPMLNLRNSSPPAPQPMSVPHAGSRGTGIIFLVSPVPAPASSCSYSRLRIASCAVH
jgi:hypothetical protein